MSKSLISQGQIGLGQLIETQRRSASGAAFAGAGAAGALVARPTPRLAPGGAPAAATPRGGLPARCLPPLPVRPSGRPEAGPEAGE